MKCILEIRRSIAPMIVSILTVLIVSGCASGNTVFTDAISGASIVEATDQHITDVIPPLDGDKRILVVGYFKGNQSRRVAADLSTLTRGDLELVEEDRERRGFWGFIRAGGDSTFRLSSSIRESTHDPADYDAVYVCTPVWAGNLSPPMRSWLHEHREEMHRIAFVTVSGETEPFEIARDMTRTVGIEPFVVVGFKENDFLAANRNVYVAKIAALIEPLR